MIEVKGGHVALDGLTWTQTSSGGLVTRIHPVDQARTCKYLLRHYLRSHPRWRHGDPRMVHLVAFPYTAVPEDFAAPDCPRWMVLGRDDEHRAAARVLQALQDAEEAPPPSAAQVEDLIACVAGQLLPQRDVLAQVTEHESVCDLLTSEQARVLDLVRLTPRVEVRGGAGSGKTWLAVEQARRLAAAGQKVGLLCYSRGLALYLRRRTDALPARQRPAYAGTFHGLGTQWLGAPSGSDDDSAYWEQSLPRTMARLAAARDREDRFDALVVDEAQDFADEWWPAVLAALKDDASGGLYVFADEGQRVFARQGRPPVPLMPIVLDENLRNTRQIAETFASLAPMQTRRRGGDGPPVRFVHCAASEAVTVADDEAVALLEQGWPAQHVALLTTHHRHPMQVEQQKAGQDAYWQTYWDGEDVFYGHVLGFKGLERPAVVLALNGFRSPDRSAERLYVGLSRARDLLVVCGDAELVRRYGGPEVAARLGISP